MLCLGERLINRHRTTHDKLVEASKVFGGASGSELTGPTCSHHRNLFPGVLEGPVFRVVIQRHELLKLAFVLPSTVEVGCLWGQWSIVHFGCQVGLDDWRHGVLQCTDWFCTFRQFL